MRKEMKKPKFETVVTEFCYEAYERIKKNLKTNPNKEMVLNNILSDETLDEILENLNFDYHHRSRTLAKRCLEVITVTLIRNPINYKTLLAYLKKLTNLRENRIYIYIKTYLPILGEIAQEVNIRKWMPKFHRRPYNYEDIKEMVRKVGLEKSGVPGTVLTSKGEYQKSIETENPAHTYILVSCNIDGHKPWEITPSNMSKGKWCRKCYIENMKLTYEDIQKLSRCIGMKKIGIPGKLLTSREEFKNLTKTQIPSRTKLKFLCNVKGHNAWETTPNTIKDNKWCPECAGYYHETIARWYFEQIFGAKFHKTNLRDIISNYTGTMHFDGYAELNLDGKRIKTAFERNGRQHYEFPNQFHKTIEDFLKRLEYDFKKEELARNNDIILIQIQNTISPENMQEFIIREFETMTGLKLPKLPKFNHQTRFIQSRNLNNFL